MRITMKFKAIDTIDIYPAELETTDDVNLFIRALITAAQAVWPDYRARLAVTNAPESSETFLQKSKEIAR